MIQRRDYREPDRHQRVNDGLALFFLAVIFLSLMGGTYVVMHHLQGK